MSENQEDPIIEATQPFLAAMYRLFELADKPETPEDLEEAERNLAKGLQRLKDYRGADPETPPGIRSSS